MTTPCCSHENFTPTDNLFICDRWHIKRYLKQCDVKIGRRGEISFRHKEFTDSQTVIKLPEGDYIIEIRHQNNGYCGAIRVMGYDRTIREYLLDKFFRETGATKVSDEYISIFVLEQGI